MWCQTSSFARVSAARPSTRLVAHHLTRKHHHVNHSSVDDIAQQTRVLLALSPSLRGIDQQLRCRHNDAAASRTSIHTMTRTSHSPSLVCLHERRSGDVASITLGPRHRCRSRCTQGLSHLHTLANATSTLKNGVTSTRRPVGWPSVFTDAGGGEKALAMVEVGGSRKLSSWRRTPPSMPEKVFVGAVILFLIGMGILFGAVFIVLLPFIGLGFYLMRRGGPALAAFRSGPLRRFFGGGKGQGGGGGMSASGRSGAASLGSFGSSSTAGPPPESILDAVQQALAGRGRGSGGFASWVLPGLSRMMGGGLDLFTLVPKVQNEVTRRAQRHPGLSSYLGGGIVSFSGVEMSVDNSSAVIETKLSFVGRRGAGAVANVQFVREDPGRGTSEEAEVLLYEKMIVTLDDGRTLDLSDDAPGVRGMRGRSGVKGSGSSFPADNGRPVEAEFRDKR